MTIEAHRSYTVMTIGGRSTWSDTNPLRRILDRAGVLDGLPPLPGEGLPCI
ncbi:hypothetical protein [Nonomuraea jabiensis]|uniref:hypothetical protein n=1 Tax=Nonomuraea jabiensis TaxID=882448 RepID=UPI003D753E1B